MCVYVSVCVYVCVCLYVCVYACVCVYVWKGHKTYFLHFLSSDFRDFRSSHENFIKKVFNYTTLFEWFLILKQFCDLLNMLIKLICDVICWHTIVVNFINITQANFTYKSAFLQLFLLTCNFQKDVCTKKWCVKRW